jgi:hypothetical protein
MPIARDAARGVARLLPDTAGVGEGRWAMNAPETMKPS